PDGAGELGGGQVLEQVAGGAGPQRLHDVLLVVERGQHHHLAGGQLPADPRGRLGAVAPGHADVHQDHVRLQSDRPLDRLLTVAGGAHHVYAGLDAQQGRDPVADELLVVGHQDADRRSRRACGGRTVRLAGHAGTASAAADRGMVTVTVVPAPGRLWTSACPPARAARSRMPTNPKPLCACAPRGDGSKPHPSSETTSRTSRSPKATDMETRRAPLCLRAFVRASCAARNTAVRAPAAMAASSPVTVRLTCGSPAPACRASPVSMADSVAAGSSPRSARTDPRTSCSACRASERASATAWLAAPWSRSRNTSAFSSWTAIAVR